MLVESRNTSRAFTSKYVTKTAVYGEKLQQNLRFRRIYDDLTAFVVIDLGSEGRLSADLQEFRCPSIYISLKIGGSLMYYIERCRYHLYSGKDMCETQCESHPSCQNSDENQKTAEVGTGVAK